MSTENKKPKSAAKKYWPLFVTMIVVTVVCIVYGIVMYDNSARGTFGDMFGALTAWFSGLAFVGIIFTIWLQMQELELQRKELRLTRREFKAQNLTLRKQRFENIFSNLLARHLQMINNLSFQENSIVSKHYTGYDSFRTAHELLLNKAGNYFVLFKKEQKIPHEKTLDEILKDEREAFVTTVTKVWYSTNPHNLHLYFLSLKGILRSIHRSALLDSDEERKQYALIFRDQISYYEQPIILYCSLLPEPWLKGVSFYVKKYDMINSVNLNALITTSDKQMFDQWADTAEPRD